MKSIHFLILTTLSLGQLLPANSSTAYRIPIELEPENSVLRLTFSGSQITSLFSPEPSTDDAEESVWASGTPLSPVAGKAIAVGEEVIPAFVTKPMSMEGSRLYLGMGMQFSLQGDPEVTFVGSAGEKEANEPIDLALPENADKEFLVEVRGASIPAELLLPWSSQPPSNNPIRLVQARAPSETAIEYQFSEKVLTDPSSTITVLFIGEQEDLVRVVGLDVRSREGEAGLWGSVLVPHVHGGLFEGDFSDAKKVVAACLVSNKKGEHWIQISEVEVTRPAAGIIAALIAAVLFLVSVSFFSRDAKPPVPSYLIPFRFAITPMGRFSISLTQAFFWTAIVLGAGVYVSYTREEFLEVTNQMLVLLGLAGGTALSAKAAAMSRVGTIPQEYLPEKRRNPKFSDLFSIGGQPNLFKFQIFAFTLAVGIGVIREIFKTGNFPVLDDNILVLIGISGGAYVANELASPGEWREVRTNLEQIKEKKNKQSEAELAIEELKAKRTVLEEALKTAVNQTREAELNKELLDAQTDLGKEIAKKSTLAKQVEQLEDKVRSKLEKMYVGEAPAKPSASAPAPAAQPAIPAP